MHDSLLWLTPAEVPRLVAEPKLLPKGLWKKIWSQNWDSCFSWECLIVWV